MRFLNKIIYYNKTMYKIVRTTKNYFYINTIEKDNEAIINSDSYEYINILPKIEEEKLTHFVDILTKEKEIKIKKINLKNYLIIDDIDNVYLVNNEIKQDYYKNWKNNLFSTHCINIYIIYHIYLLTDEYIRNNKKEFRESKLFLFFCYIKIIKKACNIIDIRDITKKLNLDDKYLILLNENDEIFLKDKKIINNCSCCVCLSNVKQYVGFYKCNHSFCHDCYKKWSDISIYCPTCRCT